MTVFGYIRKEILPLLVTLKIEPFIFLFISSTSLSDLTATQLVQDKICLFRYNRSAEYCAQISNEKTDFGADSYKTKILADLAQYIIYRTIISSLPSILFSIFIGSWIDKYVHGRKILLCLGCLGHALQFGILLLNALYFNLDVYYILLAYVPSALTGSWTCVWLAAYSYISNNSLEKYRIIKFALFEISVFTGGPFGTYMGGKLLGEGYPHSNGRLYNYMTVFATSLGSQIAALIWILVVINEKKSIHDQNSNLINSTEEESKFDAEKNDEQTQDLKSDDNLLIYKMFDIENVKEVIRTCFKSRPNKGRAQIWLLYLSMCILMISNTSNSPILFPYVEDVFHWDAELFSTVKSIAPIANIIGVALVVPLLSGFFKVKDTNIGLIGFTSIFLAALLLGTIVSPTGLYISYLAGSLTGAASIAIRSLLSKIVSESEIGKVFSLLAALETVVPSLNSVFYNTLFEYTIDFYPSLCYQIAASLVLIPLSVFMWIDMTRIQFY